MTRWLVFGWAVLVVMACGGYQPPAIGACGDGTALAEEPCEAGNFVAVDRCFVTKAAACGCLSCDKWSCVASEGDDPPKVTCKAPD